MPTTETLWIRRSQPFDLKLKEGRRNALQLLVGLVRYLESGQAKIGLLQRLLEQSFRSSFFSTTRLSCVAFTEKPFPTFSG